MQFRSENLRFSASMEPFKGPPETPAVLLEFRWVIRGVPLMPNTKGFGANHVYLWNDKMR